METITVQILNVVYDEELKYTFAGLTPEEALGKWEALAAKEDMDVYDEGWKLEWTETELLSKVPVDTSDKFQVGVTMRKGNEWLFCTNWEHDVAHFAKMVHALMKGGFNEGDTRMTIYRFNPKSAGYMSPAEFFTSISK